MLQGRCFRTGCEVRSVNANVEPGCTQLSVAEVLARLGEKHDLPAEAVTTLMDQFLGGQVCDADVAAILLALKSKGETAEEIAAAAQALRRFMTPLLAGRSGLLDTCGMGGDGSSTFNISTATAFVAAAAGVPVVKHGNRGVSSRCGSSDVLQELGVSLTMDEATARVCLDQASCVFCFAPHYHPALRQFAELRRRLGVRTLFNLAGPLANPAGAEFQLLGVARPELLDPVAGAVARLGTTRAILVCGADGLDEVSLGGETWVRIVHQGRVDRAVWVPTDFGLEPCTIDHLRIDTPGESAAVIRGVLAGADGPALRMVLANAAAALLAAQRVADLREGVAMAREAITTGRAAHVLERIIELSNGRQSCHEKSCS
jgi:anthranilate phosphoribosyltransferase